MSRLLSLCVRLYRDFELHHAGQKHVCIGTEKLGRSLYEFLKKNQYRGFQLHSVRLFAYQLISAVAFCHSIGLIHTDLKVSTTMPPSLSCSLVACSSFSLTCMLRAVRRVCVA